MKPETLARKRILFIAPLPPPIHGQSLASKTLLQNLETDLDVSVVDLARPPWSGMKSIALRLLQILQIWLKIAKQMKNSDYIYLTISESLLGNIKDLGIYLICWSRLSRTTVHLHGGAGMRTLTSHHPVFATANVFFLRRVRSVILLGDSMRDIFEPRLPREKVYTVHNFADDSLLIDRSAFLKKHSDLKRIEILYLSNMIASKGYGDLLHAISNIPTTLREHVHFHFAGAFSSHLDEMKFRSSIDAQENITYHGLVTGEKKKSLLHACQLFCLPTYYPYEGQPISILEAYASGSVVLTTNHSGIFDIFQPDVNGYEIEKQRPSSIINAIKKLFHSRSSLIEIGWRNRELARINFTEKQYNIATRRAIGVDR